MATILTDEMKAELRRICAKIIDAGHGVLDADESTGDSIL